MTAIKNNQIKKIKTKDKKWELKLTSEKDL